MLAGWTVIALALSFAMLLVARSLKDGRVYLESCSGALDQSVKLCPDLSGNASAVYRQAFVDIRDASGASDWVKGNQEFPKVPQGRDDTLLYNYCERSGPATWNWSVVDGAASCRRIDEAPAFIFEDGELDAMCYGCSCSLEYFANLTGLNCDEFERGEEQAETFGRVSVVMVVVVNQLIKMGIWRSAKYLRAHTNGEEMASISYRVFMSQVLNTALLILLTSFFARVGIVAIPGRHFDSPNAQWYQEVASPVVFTMALQFVTPALLHLVIHLAQHWLIRPIKAWRSRTQFQLNRSQEPLDYDLAASYGEVLLAMAVPLLFGSGVPLLYWVAAIGFAWRFWFDRYAVLRLYSKPPQMAITLTSSFDAVGRIILLGHSALSVYFIGSAGSAANFLSARMILTYMAFFMVFAVNIGTLGRPTLVRLLQMLGCKRSSVCVGCLSSSVQKDETKEKLKPFSEAFRAREIANERDHYRCSSFDDCNALTEAFLIRLDEQKNLGKHPFKDEKRWLKQKADTAKKTGSPGSMVERFTSDPHGHGPSVYYPVNPMSHEVYFFSQDNEHRVVSSTDTFSIESQDEIYKAVARAVKVRRSADVADADAARWAQQDRQQCLTGCCCCLNHASKDSPETAFSKLPGEDDSDIRGDTDPHNAIGATGDIEIASPSHKVKAVSEIEVVSDHMMRRRNAVSSEVSIDTDTGLLADSTDIDGNGDATTGMMMNRENGAAAEAASSRAMTPEVRARVLSSVAANALFASSTDSKVRKVREDVVDAMFVVEKQPSEAVFEQGDVGDTFYVIESGRLEVLINGVCVHTLDGEGSFGELALMYQQPRTATVRATATTGPCVLWALHRRDCLRIQRTSEQQLRNDTASFLCQVPLFSTLRKEELTHLTDLCVRDGSRCSWAPGESQLAVGRSIERSITLLRAFLFFSCDLPLVETISNESQQACLARVYVQVNTS